MSLLYRLLELLETELSFWKSAPTLRYGDETVLMEIPEYSRGDFEWLCSYIASACCYRCTQ